jgi:hypothetical protein
MDDARLWLIKNKGDLAKHICQISLERINARLNRNDDLDQKESQFVSDIEDYLTAIIQCLSLGRPNLLDKVRAEIHPVIHPNFYAEAFKIIRDEKVMQELSADSRKEIGLYLNHLIELF